MPRRGQGKEPSPLPSVPTYANTTPLSTKPSNHTATKAIPTDRAISILLRHASPYAVDTDIHRAISLAIVALQAKRDTTRSANQDASSSPVHPDLRRLITEPTDRILHKISQTSPGKHTCAAPYHSSARPQHEASVPPRVAREITIKPSVVTNEPEKATGADIVRETSKALGNSTPSVIAARKLPSGDFHLTFASAAKRNLYDNDSRLRSLFRADCTVHS
ncbi:hypothetical protein K3495_g586 [Podosphaera aphanis]|nr:hypothetical protein K3495_g586 [Podosphaera aphanis]